MKKKKLKLLKLCLVTVVLFLESRLVTIFNTLWSLLNYVSHQALCQKVLWKVGVCLSKAGVLSE